MAMAKSGRKPEQQRSNNWFYNLAMKFIVLALAVSLPLTAFAHKVVGIADGDTLTLLVDQKPLQIRLANVDAPEKRQAFGRASRKSLSAMCVGKDAYYEPQNIDQYGRTVAVVNCGGVEVNHAQVKRGLAWVCTKYNNDLSLYAIQAEAKRSHKGLWAHKSTPPPGCAD
jgi:micrococcal nuclease